MSPYITHMVAPDSQIASLWDACEHQIPQPLDHDPNAVQFAQEYPNSTRIQRICPYFRSWFEYENY